MHQQPERERDEAQQHDHRHDEEREVDGHLLHGQLLAPMRSCHGMPPRRCPSAITPACGQDGWPAWEIQANQQRYLAKPNTRGRVAGGLRGGGSGALPRILMPLLRLGVASAWIANLVIYTFV